MGKKTGISWCDSTASPWYGCTKVSPGCKNCYAETWATRGGKDIWGKGKPREKSKSFERHCRNWDAISHTNIEAHPDWAHVRTRVFPSLCDWLDDEVLIDWLEWFLRIVRDCENLDFLLLTKRPELFTPRLEKIAKYSDNRWVSSWLDGQPPNNVWLGVSVENQKTANVRIPLLATIPAKVKFLSVEPLLERINLGESVKKFLPVTAQWFPDWVIVGGESGHKRRDCGVDAICDVVKQCVLAQVPVWTKQDCARNPGVQGRIPDAFWIQQLPRP